MGKEKREQKRGRRNERGKVENGKADREIEKAAQGHGKEKREMERGRGEEER